MAFDKEAVTGEIGSYEAHLRHVESRKASLRRELETCLRGADDIVLEIGCGHGHWLTDYAAQHDESICLGIDLIGNRIERANRKASRAGLANLYFIRAEATELLDALAETVRIKAVFILFPDPWPKKRHWKNRIMNADFLDRLANRCRGGARLHFRTDHSEYFEWASSQVVTLKNWVPAEAADWPFERETVFQSKADTYQSMILEKPSIGKRFPPVSS